MKTISIIFILVFAICSEQIQAAPRPFHQLLYIGNSITVHPVTDFWWANYGMAASAPEKDFVHVLTGKIRGSGSPAAQYSAYYDAAWENNFHTFNKSTFDYQFIPAPDLVIIHLGENVAYTPAYDDAFLELIDYVEAHAPNATIIITGSFWANHSLSDNAQRNAANAHHIPFVPLAFLDSEAHRSSIGATVTASDGTIETIWRQDVAAHPNDEAMRLMANEIYKTIYQKNKRTRFF